MSTPREDFTQATHILLQVQSRLDTDRRNLDAQRRMAAQFFPYANQAAQREDFIRQSLEAVRRGIERVSQAREVREQKYDALTDPTEADGWL